MSKKEEMFRRMAASPVNDPPAEVDREAFAALCARLMAEENEKGWDLDPNLYILHGGPVLEADRVPVLGPYMPDFLAHLIHAGLYLNDGAVGLMAISEGWGVSGEAAMKIPAGTSYANLPPEVRIETRMLSAVFRNESYGQILHVRDQPIPELAFTPVEIGRCAKVPSRLYALLTGDTNLLNWEPS